MDMGWINIYICDETSDSAFIKEALIKEGFSKVKIFNCPNELIYSLSMDTEREMPDIIISEAFFKSSSDFQNMEVLTLFKEICPNCIIICTGKNTFINESMSSVAALTYGCDSWVDKNDSDYIIDMIYKVKHWASYLVEKEKLNQLYKSITASIELTH